MTPFTPYTALLGGSLIGLAAAILMLCNGRIAGISGIVSGTFSDWNTDNAWRFYFLGGVMLAPLIYQLLGGKILVEISPSTPLLVVAGLLVGYGARLGNGCTSGHGVCGLARLSKRSAAATVTFMASAGITVYFMRHLLGH